MVGGLADWFAVVALFRHPLGLPIPHTAIVVERKDQFAATLGEFIQESFLTPDAIVGRLRGAGVVGRLADWLAEPANASRVAAEVADAVVAVADLLRDDDVHRAIEGVVRNRVEAVPLAPLAGQALRFATRDGRHDEVLDRALAGLRRYIEDHRADLRGRLGKKSTWWIPGAVDHKLFDRVLDGFCSALAEIEGDRRHELRRELDLRLAKLASELETSPELRERGEQIKRDLLDQPELQRWVAELWSDAKDTLRAEAADPDSRLRRRLAEGIVGAGRRLQTDPVLAARVRGGAGDAGHLRGRALPGRDRGPGEHHHRPLGRGGDRLPPRAAPRPRPAVRPHQRHRRRRRRRPPPPRRGRHPRLTAVSRAPAEPFGNLRR